MNTEQLRAAFEAWIASPPYEKPLDINPEASGFPGQYRAYEVQLAWEAYQAGRAAPAQPAAQNQGEVQRLRESLELMINTHDEGGWPTASITIARAALSAPIALAAPTPEQPAKEVQ